MTGLGVAAGPISGGWLLEHHWWGSVFAGLIPVAAIVAALVAVRVPTSRDPDTPRLDVAGLVLSTAAIVGTKLAVRIGNKAVVAAGLASIALAFTWISTASAATTYRELAVQMILLGPGLGLTSAPATEAIMGVVPKEKAGIGSAMNDATRELGGTLGVAVIGSVFASLYAGRLALPAGLPVQAAQAARASVGGAFIAAGRVADAGLGPVAAQLRTAASAAFFDGFAVGCLVAAGVALTGAIAAAILLPAQPHVATDDAAADAVVDTTAEPALVHAA